MIVERYGKGVIVRHLNGCCFFSSSENDYDRNVKNARNQLEVLVKYAEYTYKRRKI